MNSAPSEDRTKTSSCLACSKSALSSLAWEGIMMVFIARTPCLVAPVALVGSNERGRKLPECSLGLLRQRVLEVVEVLLVLNLDRHLPRQAGQFAGAGARDHGDAQLLFATVESAAVLQD